MPKFQISEIEAAEIFKERFSPVTTPRSEAYKRGFKERLQRTSFPGGVKNDVPFKAGTSEFDAWFCGFDGAENSIACFCYHRDEQP